MKKTARTRTTGSSRSQRTAPRPEGARIVGPGLSMTGFWTTSTMSPRRMGLARRGDLAVAMVAFDRADVSLAGRAVAAAARRLHDQPVASPQGRHPFGRDDLAGAV